MIIDTKNIKKNTYYTLFFKLFQYAIHFKFCLNLYKYVITIIYAVIRKTN